MRCAAAIIGVLLTVPVYADLLFTASRGSGEVFRMNPGGTGAESITNLHRSGGRGIVADPLRREVLALSKHNAVIDIIPFDGSRTHTLTVNAGTNNTLSNLDINPFEGTKFQSRDSSYVSTSNLKDEYRQGVLLGFAGAPDSLSAGVKDDIYHIKDNVLYKNNQVLRNLDLDGRPPPQQGQIPRRLKYDHHNDQIYFSYQDDLVQNIYHVTRTDSYGRNSIVVAAEIPGLADFDFDPFSGDLYLTSEEHPFTRLLKVSAGNEEAHLVCNDCVEFYIDFVSDQEIFQFGDADLDRDVDITDFQILASNFDPFVNESLTWGRADFDGDWDVDTTDFDLLARHFAPTGYPLPSFSGSTDAAVVDTVPEPVALILFAVGMMFVLRSRTARSC